MELLFWIGFLLILGYMSKLFSDRFKIPAVTLYLIIGMFLSPEITNIMPKHFVKNIDWIIDFAIAVIAFIIGGSVKLKVLEKSQKVIAYITLLQAQMAFFLTAIALYFILPFFIPNATELSDFIFYFTIALFLGAIASTTAPTTTLAVIHQYKSAGIVTTALIAIVALDDILSIVNYSLAYSINISILESSTKEMLTILGMAFLSIGASILLGVVFAYFTIWIVSKIKSKSLISICLGNILVAYTIAHFIHLEALLTIMVFGLFLANRSDYFNQIFDELERVYLDIIFMLFFMVSGMHVNLEQVATLWHISLIYVLLRTFGKLLGTYLGAKLSHANKNITENLGYALLPQAGVALGLSMLVLKEFPQVEIAMVVFNIILVATVVHEILGPLLTKYALKASHEIKED